MYSDKGQKGHSALGDAARRNRTRLAILALLARRGRRPMSADLIRRELPGRPCLELVRYHLKVLSAIALVVSTGGSRPLYELG